MINVMLDPLPEEWNGYKVNTSFRIGIQVSLAQYDKYLNKYEKGSIRMGMNCRNVFSGSSTDGFMITRDLQMASKDWLILMWISGAYMLISCKYTVLTSHLMKYTGGSFAACCGICLISSPRFCR